MSHATISEASANELVARLVDSTLATMDVLAIYLGDQLGLYRALAEGPATAAELARRAGIDARYAREWAEQQSLSGILRAAPERDGEHRFSLPDGYREVLVDTASLNHMAPMARFLVASLGHGRELVEAFRTGGGVSWDDLGDDAREAQAALNRPMFEQLLATEYLPSVPEVHERLTAPGARVADIGCGYGWSSVAIARGYPEARVDGFDVDEPSIRRARRIAEERGLSDRVRFACIDANSVGGGGAYDVVTAFECLHDMPDPGRMLRTMRRLVSPYGSVLIADERVADRFDPENNDPVERLMYGFSIGCCLPSARVNGSDVATGTVLRRPALQTLAEEAGFRTVEVLDIEHEMLRFYRLAA
mgnify:CR=1 FL=1